MAATWRKGRVPHTGRGAFVEILLRASVHATGGTVAQVFRAVLESLLKFPGASSQNSYNKCSLTVSVAMTASRWCSSNEEQKRLGGEQLMERNLQFQEQFGL